MNTNISTPTLNTCTLDYGSYGTNYAPPSFIESNPNLGTVTTGTAEVNDLFINGKVTINALYDSNWFAISTGNNIPFTHNLKLTPDNLPRFSMLFSTNNTDTFPIFDITNQGIGYSNSDGFLFEHISNNQVNIISGNSSVAHYNNGSLTTNATSGYYRFKFYSV